MLLVSDTKGESPRRLVVQIKLKILEEAKKKHFPTSKCSLPKKKKKKKMQLAYGTGSTGLSNEKTDLSQLC